jgi:hypothetical protein
LQIRTPRCGTSHLSALHVIHVRSIDECAVIQPDLQRMSNSKVMLSVVKAAVNLPPVLAGCLCDVFRASENGDLHVARVVAAQTKICDNATGGGERGNSGMRTR